MPGSALESAAAWAKHGLPAQKAQEKTQNCTTNYKYDMYTELQGLPIQDVCIQQNPLTACRIWADVQAKLWWGNGPARALADHFARKL